MGVFFGQADYISHHHISSICDCLAVAPDPNIIFRPEHLLNTKTFEVFNNLEFTVPILMLEVHMK